VGRRLTIEEACHRYPDLLPDQVWTGDRSKYWFKCTKDLEHPDYLQLFSSHWKSGCPACARIRQTAALAEFKQTERGREACQKAARSSVAAQLAKGSVLHKSLMPPEVRKRAFENSIIRESDCTPLGQYGNHVQWHVNRNIPNPKKCRFCRELGETSL
jgi:hypothetical protein